MHDTTPCPRCGARRDTTVHRCPAAADVLGLPPAALRVLEVLSAVGRPVVVGGTVRDALLREAGLALPAATEPDVDVELHGAPGTDVVVDALRRAGAVVVTVGAQFTVCKVLLDATHLDVAVVPGAAVDDPALDRAVAVAARHRDLTVNAVAWDPARGVFLDAVHGIDDARDRVLRHVSDTFGDDPLRVLRVVRFVARYGSVVHPDTVRLARALSDRWDTIAHERLWPEVRRLTEGDHLSAALDVLHATDWERHLPELAAVRDVPQDPTWHPEGPVHVHSGLAADAAARACRASGVAGDRRVVVVLAALLHDLGKAGDGTQRVVDADGSVRIRSIGHEVTGAVAAAALLRRLGAPRSVVREVAVLVREHMVAHSTHGAPPSLPAARRLLRRLGGTVATAEAWALVCEADSQGRGPAASSSAAVAWLDVLRSDQVSGRRTSFVTGRDLVDAGLAPGPRFRTLLAEAAEAQDDGVFDDAASGRRWLAARLAEATPAGD